MLLHDAFEASARRLPDKTALVAGAQRLSYAELHRRVHTLAQALREDGVRPGDRVLLLLENTPEYAIAVHAVLAIGAVIVPIGATCKADKLAFLLADTGASALLTQASLAGAWLGPLADAATLCTCRVAGKVDTGDPRVRPWPPEDATATPLLAARIDQDLAALIYTSGSTGVPKGVMLTHLNMVSAWASVQAYLGLREDDVIGLALPPVFSYGLYNLLMGLGVGATVVLERTVAFPVRLAESLARERVTVFPGVPTLFAALLGLSDLARFDFGALRLVTNAAAALPEVHLQRLRAAWPRALLYSMYGLTECKRASYLAPEQLAQRPGSVGRGIPNQEHWLVDEHGARVPPGGTGELVLRGSHVMRGYWRRPQETHERLRPGPHEGELVLHTGDLFRTDADGYLYFVARLDDIIKTRGEKVAPREVENAIYQLEGVRDCAVVGVADASLGQAVKAYVCLQPGARLAERDIIRHCLARLESHMAPKLVEFVDELPRTESGKIRHASLRTPPADR
jgi:long-chain acyl-CoA synthetase